MKLGCEGRDLNRMILATLEAITTNDSFVAAAKTKAGKLYKQLQTDIKVKGFKNKSSTSSTNINTDVKADHVTNQINNNGGKPSIKIINQTPGIKLLAVVKNMILIVTSHIKPNVYKRNTTPTDSPIVNKQSKRKINLEYLSKGEVPVTIDDTTNNWKLNNKYNISRVFHEYRNRAIMNIEENCGPNNAFEELMKLIRAPLNITEEVKNISVLAKSDTELGIDECISWYSKAAVFKNKSEKKSYGFYFKHQKKTWKLMGRLFSSQLVEPLFCPFLAESDNVLLKGSSEESKGSKNRRGTIGRFPDLSLCCQEKDFDYALFLCEVKTTNYMISENSHPDPDFIKLINLMKDELDNMQDIPLDLKTVYSLLVQGDRLRIFAMDFSYHKLYRLVMLHQSYLPVDNYDIQRLDSCFHSVLYLESLLNNSIKELDNFFNNNSSASIPSSPLLPTESLKGFSSPTGTKVL